MSSRLCICIVCLDSQTCKRQSYHCIGTLMCPGIYVSASIHFACCCRSRYWSEKLHHVDCYTGIMARACVHD